MTADPQNHTLRPPGRTREGGLLTEIEAPISAHELERVNQLSAAERLRSSCGRAGEDEQAEGQVEEVGRGHRVHPALWEKQTRVSFASLGFAGRDHP